MDILRKKHSSPLCRRTPAALSAAVILLSISAAKAGPAFQYDPIAESIVSATFDVDFAAMNAHRSIGGNEANFVQLIDNNPGGALPDLDLSDLLFGVAAPPSDPIVNMGLLETGVLSVSLDASFFPALAGGNVGLRAVFTDTVDAMFALDFISLTIETATSEVIQSFYGWPVGNENNGFGIGLPDGEDLPTPLPNSLGATGTGFDETISSISILAIPEPVTLSLLAVGGLALAGRQRGLGW